MVKLFLLMGWVLTAQAGVINGGGGKGVLCVAADGSRTLESLDRYEARVIWKNSFPASGDFNSEFHRVTKRMHEAFNDTREGIPPYDSNSKHFWERLREFQSKINFIPDGARLKFTNDTGDVVIPPPNCSLVQVITYLDENDATGQVMIDRDYWELLTPQDQVAFFVHEWIYKVLRTLGETHSLRVRKVTGRLVSSESFPGRYAPIQGADEIMLCAGNSHSANGERLSLSFYAFPSENPETKVAETKFAFIALGRSEIFGSATAWAGQDFQSWKMMHTSPSNWSGYARSTLAVESVLGYFNVQLRLGDPDESDDRYIEPGEDVPVSSKNIWYLRFPIEGKKVSIPFNCVSLK